MNTTIKDFKDLNAWKESHQLILWIYRTTKNFPKEEIFGLTNQMRRAAVSVTSNIAEGFGRRSYKEKAYFYSLAQGSLCELENQIIVAHDIGYLKNPDSEGLLDQVKKSRMILHGLVNKTRTLS